MARATLDQQHQDISALMNLVVELGIAESPISEDEVHQGGLGGSVQLRCRAEFDNVAEQEKELSFREGDVITILTQDISGWWKGELNGQVGWFPASFVQIIDSPIPPSSSAKPRSSTSTSRAAAPAGAKAGAGAAAAASSPQTLKVASTNITKPAASSGAAAGKAAATAAAPKPASGSSLLTPTSNKFGAHLKPSAPSAGAAGGLSAAGAAKPPPSPRRRSATTDGVGLAAAAAAAAAASPSASPANGTSAGTPSSLLPSAGGVRGARGGITRGGVPSRGSPMLGRGASTAAGARPPAAANGATPAPAVGAARGAGAAGAAAPARGGGAAVRGGATAPGTPTPPGARVRPPVPSRQKSPSATTEPSADAAAPSAAPAEAATASPVDFGNNWDGIDISPETRIEQLRDALALRIFNRNPEQLAVLDALLVSLAKLDVTTVGHVLALEERDRDRNELDKRLPASEHEMFHRVTGRIKTLPFVHESILRERQEENCWDGIQITLETPLVDIREPLAKRLFGRSAEQDALLDGLLAALAKMKIRTVGELLEAEERDRHSGELEGKLKLGQHEMFYRVGGRLKTLPFILRRMEKAEIESRRAGKKKMPRAAGGRNDRVRHIRETVDFLQTQSARVLRSREMVADRAKWEEGFHYMKYASAALGIMLAGLQMKRRFFSLLDGDKFSEAVPVTHQDIVIEHTGIAASDFITGSWPMVSDFNFIPGYFIAVDRVFQSVVLALRGSTTHKDWLTDFCGTYDPFYTGKAHRGMVHSTHLLMDEVGQILFATLKDNPGYSVTVTGHSLGAGVASLFSMILHEEFPHLKVKCHAFACPCVVSPDLSMKYRSFITTYVLENDIVPRISLGSLEALRAEALCLLNQSGSNNLTRLLKAAGVKRLNPFKKRPKKKPSDKSLTQSTPNSSLDESHGSGDHADDGEYYDEEEYYEDEYYDEECIEEGEGSEHDHHASDAASTPAASASPTNGASPASPTASHSSSPSSASSSATPSSSSSPTAVGGSIGGAAAGSRLSVSESMLAEQPPEQVASGRQVYQYTCNFGHNHTYLFDRLVPPGDIFYFVRDSEKEDLVLESSCFGNFADPLIAPGMFWSHLPSQYEQAFKDLLLCQRRIVAPAKPLAQSASMPKLSSNSSSSLSTPPSSAPPRPTRADGGLNPARPPRADAEVPMSMSASRSFTRLSSVGSAPVMPDPAAAAARGRSPAMPRRSMDRATRFLSTSMDDTSGGLSSSEGAEPESPAAALTSSASSTPPKSPNLERKTARPVTSFLKATPRR